MSPAARGSRREEILDRSLDVIQEVGLGKMTFRRIAEKVGFTEAAMFRHFPSKKSLLLGLMDRLDAMLLGPIREIAADTGRSPVARLEAILKHHVELIERYNSLPMLLLAEATATGDSHLLARMRRILGDYLRILEGLITDLPDNEQRAGWPRRDCLALLLLGIPSALAIRHRLLPDPDTERRIASTLVPFVTAMITDGRVS